MKKKCQVVILSTNNDSNIRVSGQSSKLEFKDKKGFYIPEMKHLYITSNDEIKEGDYSLMNKEYGDGKNLVLAKIGKLTIYNIELDDMVFSVEHSNEIHSYHPSHLGKRRIIATTDTELHEDGVAKIGLDFIKKYITDYNSKTPIKEVNVEYDCPYNPSIYANVWSPKLNSDNTIIIHCIQETFTKEDMFIAFKELNGQEEINSKDLIEYFETWLEQNY